MSERGGGRLRPVAAVLAVACYASLSQYVNSSGSSPVLGAALALTPIVLTAVLLLRRWSARAPAAAVLAAASAVVLLIGLWPSLEQHYAWLAFAQDTGLYGLLGVSFARSLQGRRIAVCTRLADRVHGPLTPAEILYTRRVTAAWAAFFGVLAALSVGLFLWAPLRLWSWYANFSVLPLTGMMFAAEYLLRCRAFPDADRGLLRAVRTYFGDAGAS